MAGDGVRGDRVLAVVLVCLGLAVLVLARELPGPTTADPVSPRGFPGLLALVILACGVALGLSRWVRPRRAPDEEGPEARGALAPGRLAGGILLTAAYLAALEPAGFLVATPPFVAALLLVEGGVGLRVLLLAALGLPAGLYLLFAGIMGVPLPLGVLERLLRGL